MDLQRAINEVKSVPQPLRDWVVLAIFIVLCFAAAGGGSLVTIPAIDGWYASLQKPAWTPPNWVFGPVWSLLYLAMATAAWLGWRERAQVTTTPALLLFGIQLILNVLWSFLFFSWQRPGVALIEILFLWAAIFATLLTFSHFSTVAACLFVPYLIWVSFAVALNFSIWRLNV
jgi:translocator protein